MRELAKYLPDDNTTQMLYEAGTKLVEVAISGRINEFTPGTMAEELFFQTVLPRILPPKVMKVLNTTRLVGDMQAKIVEVAGIARLAQARALTAAELARGSFCCLAIANTLFSFLSVPPEIKQIVNFMTCVANLAFLIATAAPFVPIALAVVSLLGALFSMNLGLGTGCGGKKKKSGGGGSGGN